MGIFDFLKGKKKVDSEAKTETSAQTPPIKKPDDSWEDCYLCRGKIDPEVKRKLNVGGTNFPVHKKCLKRLKHNPTSYTKGGQI
jgi:hypothetical protein